MPYMAQTILYLSSYPLPSPYCFRTSVRTRVYQSPQHTQNQQYQCHRHSGILQVSPVPLLKHTGKHKPKRRRHDYKHSSDSCAVFGCCKAERGAWLPILGLLFRVDTSTYMLSILGGSRLVHGQIENLGTEDSKVHISIFKDYW